MAAGVVAAAAGGLTPNPEGSSVTNLKLLLFSQEHLATVASHKDDEDLSTKDEKLLGVYICVYIGTYIYIYTYTYTYTYIHIYKLVLFSQEHLATVASHKDDEDLSTKDEKLLGAVVGLVKEQVGIDIIYIYTYIYIYIYVYI